MPRLDEELKMDIVNQLAWDHRVDASKIQVTVENGSVQLSGTVPLFSEAIMAEDDVLDLPGVIDVENHLQTGIPPEVTAPSDMEVKSNVETVLSLSPSIDASTFRITVEKGTVILEGTVESVWQKKHAESLLAGLRGVLWIDNLLSVVPSGDIEDRLIAEDIVQALERTSLIEADRITLHVSNGTVTLTGTVANSLARRTAEQIANYTTGVREVFNELLIAGPA